MLEWFVSQKYLAFFLVPGINHAYHTVNRGLQSSPYNIAKIDAQYYKVMELFPTVHN